MSKKSPKSTPSEDTKNSDTRKNPAKLTDPKSKESIEDDDFDASLYDDDLKLVKAKEFQWTIDQCTK